MNSTNARYRLIVGLGNPGSEYAGTRHNIGFMVLDRMLLGSGEWRTEKGWNGLLGSRDGMLLVKPQTYMNLSGGCVASVARFYKIPAQSVLVVMDDMALGLGRVRLRPGGSSGGHNGLESILDAFGTKDVPRLRLGIGGAQRGDAVTHVLGKFRKDEQSTLEEVLERAEAAIYCLQREGMEGAMNAFN